MRIRASVSIAALLISVSAASLTAQRQSAKLDGAWQTVRVEVVSPDSTYLPPLRRGLLVISGQYYSQVWGAPEQSGVQQASQPTTVEQKAARYDAVIANAGTLQVQDTLVTFTPTQAKSPRVIGTNAVRRYTLRGDTLRLVFSQPWAKDSTKSVRTTMTLVRQR
jgi:hypothetical protein